MNKHYEDCVQLAKELDLLNKTVTVNCNYSKNQTFIFRGFIEDSSNDVIIAFPENPYSCMLVHYSRIIELQPVWK